MITLLTNTPLPIDSTPPLEKTIAAQKNLATVMEMAPITDLKNLFKINQVLPTC
jgi:hypothetical protein